MNELLIQFLGLIAVIIIALALSSTKDGAKIVQGGLIVAILVVILKNTSAVQNAARNLTGVVSGIPKQTGGA